MSFDKRSPFFFHIISCFEVAKLLDFIWKELSKKMIAWLGDEFSKSSVYKKDILDLYRTILGMHNFFLQFAIKDREQGTTYIELEDFNFAWCKMIEVLDRRIQKIDPTLRVFHPEIQEILEGYQMLDPTIANPPELPSEFLDEYDKYFAEVLKLFHEFIQKTMKPEEFHDASFLFEKPKSVKNALSDADLGSRS